MKNTLPPFEPSIRDDVRTSVAVELEKIEHDHQVRILFAVESGSRAWGFPSPDSDYDVRFVYAHRMDWYLSIEPGRDVIELPISDELDIAGWDIRKALGLMLKPNPVMFEWLSSPIRYRWDEVLCKKLDEFSRKPAHSSACLHHYLNLGARQNDLHLGDRDEVYLKKYFYVLRPALAIRWMRLHPQDVPPMNVQALVEDLALNEPVVDAIGDLIKRKSTMKEKERIARIGVIDDLMKAEFEWAESAEKEKDRRDLADEANQLFRDILRACDA